MLRSASSILLMSLLICGAACGSSGNAGIAGGGGGGATGGKGGGGNGGSGGTIGAAGTTGSGGGGRAGTGGAPVSFTCPATVPQKGADCTPGVFCYYEDCAGAGRTMATCVAGSNVEPQWSLTTAACGIVECPFPSSRTCAAGEICLVRAGGAFIAECVANTCGTGAITCGCIQSCIGDCTVLGSLDAGIVISCNTCPQGGCP